MKKLSDWRARLAQTIEAKRRLPIDYGTNDCALFVADCIFAMTGVDLAADIRGRYTSANDAVRLIYELGFEDLADLVASRLPEIDPVFAVNGDVAAIESEPVGWALGIYNGETVTVLTVRGLGVVGRDAVRRAFKCG